VFTVTDVIQSKIWVFVEQRQGRLAEVGLEMLGKAMALAETAKWKVAAVLVGDQLASLAQNLLSFGTDEVVVIEDPLLADYCNQAYVKALEAPIRAHKPEVLLLGATALGTDLAPRLAARLRTGLSAHCIDLDLTSDGEIFAVVPGWGGHIMAKVSCPRTRPQMATVMPGVFAVPEPGARSGKIVIVKPDISPQDITYRVLETRREEIPKSGLQAAEVVVAGGWGIGSKPDWHYVEDLASALNGAVGATRPPVDEGWADEKQMIGQSGITVRPRLYIGVGISGHMHHLVGLKSTELTVAINSDPKAAIFHYCDLGLVGDFKEILPVLVKAIKAYSGSEMK